MKSLKILWVNEMWVAIGETEEKKRKEKGVFLRKKKKKGRSVHQHTHAVGYSPPSWMDGWMDEMFVQNFQFL